jgi:hypothetical protein
MAELDADTLKAVVSVVTAVLGVAAGYFVKVREMKYRERKTEASA